MGVHRDEGQGDELVALDEARSGSPIRQRIEYGRSQRPLVEVRVLGRWRRGRLCLDVEDVAGVWWSRVFYPDPERRVAVLGRFLSDDVRRLSSPS